MTTHKDPSDERMAQAIRQAMADMGEEASADIAERVMGAIKPLVGAAAERRRSESALRESFKEGFQVGKQMGRYARWHTMIWRQSALFRAIRSRDNDNPGMAEASERYAQFNY